MDISTVRNNANILLTIKGRSAAVVGGETRAPIHFIFVLDTSGSMKHQHKLSNCIKSIIHALNYITETDYISFITFDNKASIISQGILGTKENKEGVLAAMKTLEADGGTNLYDALQSIRKVLCNMDHLTDHTIKHGIILLTDGYPTVGDVHTDALQEIVDEIICSHPSVSISTVGYGLEHNEHLLRYIAQEGGGCYSVVEILFNVASVFGYIIGTLISCTATCVKVVAEGCRPLTAYRVATPDVGRHIITIGDIGAEQEVKILFDVDNSRPGEEVTLIVSGHDTAENKEIRLVAAGTETAENDLQQIEVEKVRYAVYHLLKLVADGEIKYNAIATKKAEILHRITYMETAGVTDPLLAMLKDEVQRLTANVSQAVLSQNSMCIGFGRGVRNVDGAVDMNMATPIQREVAAASARAAGVSESTASQGMRGAVSTTDPMDVHRSMGARRATGILGGK